MLFKNGYMLETLKIISTQREVNLAFPYLIPYPQDRRPHRPYLLKKGRGGGGGGGQGVENPPPPTVPTFFYSKKTGVGPPFSQGPG